MKVVITFLLAGKLEKQCTGDDTVSRVLHIVALTTSVVKSDVEFFFL